MKIENLTKTQIVLLTLLVSFVTSIATGIVTVTLMDQAPPAVTQTINKVVEKTIQTVVPGEKQVTTVVKEVVVSEDDALERAVANVSKSVVSVGATDPDGNDVVLGLGTVLSEDGLVATDKERLQGNRNNLFVAIADQKTKARIAYEGNEFVILKAEPGETPQVGEKDAADESERADMSTLSFSPVGLSDSDGVGLGKSVAAFGGVSGETLLSGFVSRLVWDTPEPMEQATSTASEKSLKYIVTNFDVGKKNAGGPLFDASGGVYGVFVVAEDGALYAIPSNALKAALSELAGEAAGGEASSAQTEDASAGESKNLTDDK